jgi:hypothetical protein
MTFALPRLGHLVRGLSLGEPSLGRCLACGASVHPDEPSVKLHGDLFHVACARSLRSRL